MTTKLRKRFNNFDFSQNIISTTDLNVRMKRYEPEWKNVTETQKKYEILDPSKTQNYEKDYFETNCHSVYQLADLFLRPLLTWPAHSYDLPLNSKLNKFAISFVYK